MRVTAGKLKRILSLCACSLLALCSAAVQTAATEAQTPLEQLDESPHLRRVAFSSKQVIDHEIGLGAVQKVSGEWRFKRSERLSGTLISYTWQVMHGFTSAEALGRFQESLEQIEGAELLFACDGRACGRAAQWANGVFNERVLYGMEDFQRYRVFAMGGEQNARLIAYSAERTADRQYLHVALLLIAP